MLDFYCPFCNEGIHTNTCPTGYLPPTGGDYEWQELNKAHTCPHCQNTFEIRVRTSIETGEVLFINQIPKPQKAHIVWYAMASINEFGVKASAVCQDEVFARIIGLSHKRKHYEPLHLLKITSEGYFDEEGKKIEEDAYNRQKINYLKI